MVFRMARESKRGREMLIGLDVLHPQCGQDPGRASYTLARSPVYLYVEHGTTCPLLYAAGWVLRRKLVWKKVPRDFTFAKGLPLAVALPPAVLL